MISRTAYIDAKCALPTGAEVTVEGEDGEYVGKVQQGSEQVGESVLYLVKDERGDVHHVERARLRQHKQYEGPTVHTVKIDVVKRTAVDQTTGAPAAQTAYLTMPLEEVVVVVASAVVELVVSAVALTLLPLLLLMTLLFTGGDDGDDWGPRHLLFCR